MEYDSLTRDLKRIYNQTITTPGAHQRRIELQILTLDGVFVRSLSPRITTGQITVDVSASPSRVLTMSFLDPSRSLIFEPESADEAPLHRKYMARVIDSRLIPFPLGWEWIDCTVFTGPLWDFERVGALVSLTAHGAERLAMGTIRRARHWLRKTRKTKIIRELLQEAGADLTQLRIPNLPFTTAVHVHVKVVHPHKKKGEKKAPKAHKVRHLRGYSINRSDTYWEQATHLAESMDRHLFVDASGVFCLRSHPERPVLHFRTALLADVDLKRPSDEGPNTFLVTGAKPKGHKHRVSSGLVGFPHAHPLSAYALAWHGKPYQVLDHTQNPHCKTKAACRKIAIRKRDRAARVVAETSFDSVPIPWLREYDLVTAQASWGIPTVSVEQITYPLTPDSSPMTVGAVRRATPVSTPVGGHAGVS